MRCKLIYFNENVLRESKQINHSINIFESDVFNFIEMVNYIEWKRVIREHTIQAHSTRHSNLNFSPKRLMVNML